jgi:hypothetical protein
VTSAGEHLLGIACFLALVCSYPVFGNPEAEELCSVPAENTLSPAAEDRTCPYEKALKQLHMLSETAAVCTEIVHKGESAAPFELVLNLAIRSGPFSSHFVGHPPLKFSWDRLFAKGSSQRPICSLQGHDSQQLLRALA